MVTGNPASAMSSATLASSAATSTRRRGSARTSSRAKAKVEPIISFISPMVASILSRSPASATSSVRRRSSVNGVRRSCDRAASIWVRLSISRRSRSCMRLKVRAAFCISTVPATASGSAVTSRPRRSAAADSIPSGAVTRRTAQTETASTISPIKAIEMMNCHDTDGPPCGSAVANDSHWPSASLTATCRPRQAPKPPNGSDQPCIIIMPMSGRFAHRPGNGRRSNGGPKAAPSGRSARTAARTWRSGSAGSCWRT